MERRSFLGALTAASLGVALEDSFTEFARAPAPQSHSGRSNQDISRASWHHTLWKAEEIADLISYLVYPAAKWMTGASVRMDGGEIKGI
jgi:NAD(P)-dependent dehydrogenase (short-subunit alcohol dehydrogenase family)